MSIWDKRYADKKYVYGTEPNDFLVQQAGIVTGNKVLCLADGEGRNSVYLAGLLKNVVAVDLSAKGLEKAQSLAAKKGVEIITEQADLAEFSIPENSYDGIISIFCHLPPTIRKRLHQQVAQGLKLGGILILEGYTPKQLSYKTGGPPSAELMMELSQLQEEFQDFEILHGLETEREIHEGHLHNGMGAVVQLVARKN